MSKGWLAIVERHVEKGILGLCAVFLLYMLWSYILGSPNRTEFQGQQLGPADLKSAIADAARSLDRSIQQQTPAEAEVPAFAERLKAFKDTNIYADASGPLADEPQVAAATSIGRKIEVPGLETEEDANIELVSPLPPKGLAVRTGISLAVEKPIRLETRDVEAPVVTLDQTADDKAEEMSWVTVGAYWDKKAQYNEMVKAKYAPYRARAYLVRVEAQRQEMLSSGVWGDWQDVESKAMPQLTVPEPVFDDQTGKLLPVVKDEIDEAFRVLKAQQPMLMQPPFYRIIAGDYWDLPPIEGYDEAALAETADEEFTVAAIPPRQTQEPRGPRPRPTGGEGGRRGGEGGVRPPPTGRSFGGRSSAQDTAAIRAEARAQLDEARLAVRQQDFRRARDLAEQIVRSTDDIPISYKKDAQRIIQNANKREQRLVRLEGVRGDYSGVTQLVTHPEEGQPAVWFHDDSVEPGKTYRYRLRVVLWNRYVGRMRAMADPAEAKQAVVKGDWSYPSEPVTVAPASYFFVRGGLPSRQTANVEVWKWRDGWWLKENFDVAVGEVIGGVDSVEVPEYDAEGKPVRADVDFGTGAVVLDLQFDEPVRERVQGKDGVFQYRESPAVVITYLDPADGQVKQRVSVFDRFDPIRERLEEEAG